MQPDLEPGLYEHVVTRALERAISGIEDAELRDLDPSAADGPLVGHVARELRRAIAQFGESASEPDESKRAKQIALTNAVLDVIRQHADASDEDDNVSDVGQQLLAVPEPGPAHRVPQRPNAPLRQSALLVNARKEPSIGQELPLEIDSADEILLLCAFLKWSGVRIVLDALREFRERGGRLRVITTTYCGATEGRALDALAEIGAEIRVSYETQSTRLHAKAWLFERHSGLSTAYIGSSNLSHSALIDGLEWNVRLAQAETPDMLTRFRAAFETLWASEHVEDYDSDRFLDALAVERNSRATGDGTVLWEITPFPFQRAILDRLDAERHRHGRWQNLIVAATGTGKTVVAALDYQRLRRQLSGNPSLLFVAHRERILAQSRAVFQNATADASFGEIFAGGARPSKWQHVFANVQSLQNVDLEQFDPTHFDVVIIDEFHHAAAPTYERLLDYFTPKVLLGLTATPERADGQDVVKWFGGRFAAEIRLWDALDGQFLVPFHYFGVHDDVDLSDVTWRRTGYDVAELETLYTGDDARVLRVVQQVRKYVANPHAMKCLGFCVSVEHARFMADRFNHHGIPSAMIDGSMPEDERRSLVRQLESGDLNCIFSVDVLTEGVDIPTVDTILLLRPTESATVFLQQLGRGLRRAPDKSVCTVLDFIGNQRKEFRFAPRFMNMFGLSRTDLIRGVEDGFSSLPSGVHFELDRIARQTVLQNLKDSIGNRRRDQVADLRMMGEETTLAAFLEQSGRDLNDVFRSGRDGWTGLRREAGFAVPDESPDQVRLTRAVNRLTYVDDEERIAVFRKFLADPLAQAGALSQRDERLRAMFFLGLWGHNVTQEVVHLEDGLRRIGATHSVVDDLAAMFDYLDVESDRITYDEPALPDEVPLRVHGMYSTGDVMAAIGRSAPGVPYQHREGPFYSKELGSDFFFVTLDKTSGSFSPTTRYRDYAISRTLFHWETQSTQRVTTPTVQRYVNHREVGNEVFMFVRDRKTLDTGETAPFCFLGAMDYVSHEGNRPVAILWQLRRPMPESVAECAVTAAG